MGRFLPSSLTNQGNITSNGTRVQTETKFEMSATFNDFQDIIGRSIIIHELADNCVNDSAGAKIAGCVIGVASTDLNIGFHETESMFIIDAIHLQFQVAFSDQLPIRLLIFLAVLTLPN